MKFEHPYIPLHTIKDLITEKYGISLYILRTDLTHPQISGNKWFKLKNNLIEAKNKNINTLLTFGGAFSNHIAATAAAGKEYGFKTIGIIRGEEYSELNPTLNFAVKSGMKLDYVSRSLYKDKTELYKYANTKYWEDKFYLIPEGGSNELGVSGCMEISNHINLDFNYICCASGTGATLSGIILSLKKNQKAVGFQILKASGYIKNEVNTWLLKYPKICIPKSNENNNPIIENSLIQINWEVNENYHFGGYGKTNTGLKDFIKWFQQTNNVPLDFLYTGKMMFGIYDMIEKEIFKRGDTIVAIHTGGMQGNLGKDFLAIKKQNLKFQ